MNVYIYGHLYEDINLSVHNVLLLETQWHCNWAPVMKEADVQGRVQSLRLPKTLQYDPRLCSYSWLAWTCPNKTLMVRDQAAACISKTPGWGRVARYTYSTCRSTEMNGLSPNSDSLCNQRSNHLQHEINLNNIFKNSARTAQWTHYVSIRKTGRLWK
jgi:hypothetical protein